MSVRRQARAHGLMLAVVALALAVGVAGPAHAVAPATPPAAAVKKKKKRVPRFVFTFEGRGYGHGVGMSQYGAYGAALAGESAPQILARYYRGTSLAILPPTTVRVLLAANAPSLRLGASGGWAAAAEGAPLGTARPLPPGAEVTVARFGPAGVVVSDAAGAELLRSTGPVGFAATDPGALLAYRGTAYRGAFRVLVEGSGLSLVNHVPLEQYLLGVVPREMPSRWGDDAPQALQAQAIAARSYAMATRRNGASFDMYADERSQVYGGATAEDARTSSAVAATGGQVVTLNGAIVTTFFFSTSGGRTENVENVFSGAPLPYLVSVNDDRYDRTSPVHVWRDPKTFTDAQLARLLGTKRPVLSMKVIERGASPRVKQLRIVTRVGGVKVMRGTDVRRALGLRDTWFTPKRRILTPATLRLTRPPVPG